MKAIIPFCLSLFFVTAFVLVAHAESTRERNKQNIDDLLNYANQELRILDESEAELVACLADRIRKRLLHPAFIGEMKLHGDDDPHVVYVELPLKDGYPGLCRMSVTIMNRTGDLVTEPSMREFFMGSRNFVRSLRIHRDHGMKGIGDLLVADMFRGGPHHVERGKDYYTLIKDEGRVPIPRLILLARENSNGQIMPLAFSKPWWDHDRIMGQTVLSFGKETQWTKILKDSAVPRLIAALLFLSNTHDDNSGSDYQVYIDSVLGDLQRNGLLDDLLLHEISWIREYANLLSGGIGVIEVEGGGIANGVRSRESRIESGGAVESGKRPAADTD